MAGKLAIILGAGASNDCIPRERSLEYNGEWLPPLTKELFATDGRAAFQPILAHYPEIEGLRSLIIPRLASETVEEVLASFKKSNLIHITSRVRKKRVEEGLSDGVSDSGAWLKDHRLMCSEVDNPDRARLGA